MRKHTVIIITIIISISIIIVVIDVVVVIIIIDYHTCSAADSSKTHLKEMMWSFEVLVRKKIRWDTAYRGTSPNGIHSTDK